MDGRSGRRGSVHRLTDRGRTPAWDSGEAAGKKRKELERWFYGHEGPQALFAGRVLPFDEKAALVWARLMAADAAAGLSRNALDMIVAAVAEANDCVVVTDNEKDFAGLKIVNPLRVAG